MRVLLLAIDDELIATLLAAALGTQWRVAPVVRTVTGLRLEMERWKPTVLLTSLALGSESVAGVLPQLTSRYPACSIIVCHPGLDPAIREFLQLAGVKGIIDYHTTADQLRAHLESLLMTGEFPSSVHGEPTVSDAGAESQSTADRYPPPQDRPASAQTKPFGVPWSRWCTASVSC